VLGGAPAGEHSDPQRPLDRLGAHGRHHPDAACGVGAGGVGVVGVVVGGGGVVVVSTPTVIVTVAPLRALAPPAGFCSNTIPACAGSVVDWDTAFGLKPAC